jgi:hypothetical protein
MHFAFFHLGSPNPAPFKVSVFYLGFAAEEGRVCLLLSARRQGGDAPRIFYR